MPINLKTKSRRLRKNNIRHSRKKNTIHRVSNYVNDEQMHETHSSSSLTNLSSTCIQTCKNLFKKYDLQHIKSISDVITNELLKYNTQSLIDYIKMNYNKKYGEIFCAHFKNNECVKSYVDTLMPRLDNFKYVNEDKPNFTGKSIDILLDKINNIYSLYYNIEGGSPTNPGETQNEEVCCICLEPLDYPNRIVIHPLNCMHRMHAFCARAWWRRTPGGVFGFRPSCPTCRTVGDLPNETPAEIQERRLLENPPSATTGPSHQMSLMPSFRSNPRNQRIGKWLIVAVSYIAYRWDLFFNPDFAGPVDLSGFPIFVLITLLLLAAFQRLMN